uniref:Putative secreted protein n=1 Tax=Anopheles darlingi TaxID=43151 RepID=A0A2M4DKA3_ANODA
MAFRAPRLRGTPLLFQLLQLLQRLLFNTQSQSRTRLPRATLVIVFTNRICRFPTRTTTGATSGLNLFLTRTKKF